MNKLKITLVTVFTTFILIMMVGCQKKAPTILTIGVLPNLDSIPLIIASEKGLIPDTIQLSYFKSAVDRDTALQTGNIDGTASDFLSAIFLKDNGFDMQVTSMTQGTFALVTSPGYKDTPLSDGASVGISSNTIIEYLVDQYTAKEGIELNKVAIPKMPTRLEMLQNNKIDTAMLPEPLASAAVLGGGSYVTTSDIIGTNPAVMIFSQKAIANKEKLIKAFYKGYNEAVDYLGEADPKEYMDLVIDKAGFPPVTKDVLVLPNYVHAKVPAPEELESVNTWMMDLELTTNRYTLDELVDDSFINK